MSGGAARYQAILFDFFGTLVRYSPSRAAQGYPQTYALLGRLGADLSYDAFLRAWVEVSEQLDRWSAREAREFSMDDVARAFLARVAPELAPSEHSEPIWRSYVAEWEKGIAYIPGVPELVRSLAARSRLALVTNTHHAPLVARHLDALGVADCFGTVVTSIEHGRPKPHPSIFEAALSRLGGAPEDALFVGDSFEADYQGARNAGMQALLIDPDRTSAAPAADVIPSILDLARYLDQE